jgi:cell division septal protein FtsQ
LSRVEDRLTGVSIDPRIRARRIEVQRDAGRRRLRRVVDLGLLLAVAAGFFGALRSPLLDVESVRVSGADRSGVEAVVAASGISRGEQLIDVHLRAAGSQVAALPWVGEVHVHRSLGGTVEIAVTERDPAAVLGEGAAAVVVDADGRVLARVSDVPEVASGLVHVAGITGNLAPGAFLGGKATAGLTLAGRLASVVPGAIAQVSVGDELVATLAQGGEVLFGDTTRLSAKLRSLETMLEQVDLTCLGRIDLRAPGSPVLTRQEGCS